MAYKGPTVITVDMKPSLTSEITTKLTNDPTIRKNIKLLNLTDKAAPSYIELIATEHTYCFQLDIVTSPLIWQTIAETYKNISVTNNYLKKKELKRILIRLSILKEAENKFFKALQIPNPKLWITEFASLIPYYCGYAAARDMAKGEIPEEIENAVAKANSQLLARTNLSSLLILSIQRFPRLLLLLANIKEGINPQSEQFNSVSKLYNLCQYGNLQTNSSVAFASTMIKHFTAPTAQTALAFSDIFDKPTLAIAELRHVLSIFNYLKLPRTQSAQFSTFLTHKREFLKKQIPETISSPKTDKETNFMLAMQKTEKEAQANLASFVAIEGCLADIRSNQIIIKKIEKILNKLSDQKDALLVLENILEEFMKQAARGEKAYFLDAVKIVYREASHPEKFTMILRHLNSYITKDQAPDFKPLDEHAIFQMILYKPRSSQGRSKSFEVQENEKPRSQIPASHSEESLKEESVKEGEESEDEKEKKEKSAIDDCSSSSDDEQAEEDSSPIPYGGFLYPLTSTPSSSLTLHSGASLSSSFPFLSTQKNLLSHSISSSSSSSYPSFSSHPFPNTILSYNLPPLSLPETGESISLPATSFCYSSSLSSSSSSSSPLLSSSHFPSYTAFLPPSSSVTFHSSGSALSASSHPSVTFHFRSGRSTPIFLSGSPSHSPSHSPSAPGHSTPISNTHRRSSLASTRPIVTRSSHHTLSSSPHSLPISDPSIRISNSPTHSPSKFVPSNPVSNSPNPNKSLYLRRNRTNSLPESLESMSSQPSCPFPSEHSQRRSTQIQTDYSLLPLAKLYKNRSLSLRPSPTSSPTGSPTGSPLASPMGSPMGFTMASLRISPTESTTGSPIKRASRSPRRFTYTKKEIS